MKAQVSVEYLVILGVSFLILIPFFLYGNQSMVAARDNLRVSMVKNAVEKIGQSADWVYSQGSPAKVTVMVYIPEQVEAVSIHNHEINFRVRTTAGVTDVFYITKGNVSGNIPNSQGYYNVFVVANDSLVWIGVS